MIFLMKIIRFSASGLSRNSSSSCNDESQVTEVESETFVQPTKSSHCL